MSEISSLDNRRRQPKSKNGCRICKKRRVKVRLSLSYHLLTATTTYNLTRSATREDRHVATASSMAPNAPILLQTKLACHCRPFRQRRKCFLAACMMDSSLSTTWNSFIIIIPRQVSLSPLNRSRGAFGNSLHPRLAFRIRTS